jgi:hypothetical protein
MPNTGQPTIKIGASGPVVKRLQRALRRTPNLGLVVDGVFGAQLEATVKDFQQGAGLTVDGVVGPLTWAALPDGGPMPTLQEGSSGKVVESLQRLPLDWSDRMGRDARRHRRHFRAAHEGFGHSVPKVGRRDSGRNRRRPDVGCFVARGELHLGDGGRVEFRHRITT